MTWLLANVGYSTASSNRQNRIVNYSPKHNTKWNNSNENEHKPLNFSYNDKRETNTTKVTIYKRRITGS